MFFLFVCLFVCPALLIFNQFLDQTLTLYECCIKLQQGERELCIPHTILCHPTMSIPNTRPDYYFRAGGMLKEGSRENTEDWIIMMGLSTQVLLSSSPGLCRPICSYQLHLHHSSQVMRISLPEDRRNPTFTPALYLSARNWLPQGHLINNVWMCFWLSQPKRGDDYWQTSRQRSGMLLHILQYTGLFTKKRLFWPKCQQC